MNAKTILVPVDFSDVTPRVTEAAGSIAAAFGGRLILLHVKETQPDFVGFEPGAAPMQMPAAVPDENVTERQLADLRVLLQQGGIEATVAQVEGAIVESIIAAAEGTEPT